MKMEDDWDYKLYIAEQFLKTIESSELRNIGRMWIDRLKKLDALEYAAFRSHVLKLMNVSLQNNRLVGPFKKVPPKSNKKLEALMCNYKASQIKNRIMNAAFDELIISEPVPPLPVRMGCCTILQLIPQYGGHFYHTSSSESLKCANDLKKRDMPIGSLYIFPAYCTRNLYNFEYNNDNHFLTPVGKK